MQQRQQVVANFSVLPQDYVIISFRRQSFIATPSVGARLCCQAGHDVMSRCPGSGIPSLPRAKVLAPLPAQRTASDVFMLRTHARSPYRGKRVMFANSCLNTGFFIGKDHIFVRSKGNPAPYSLIKVQQLGCLLLELRIAISLGSSHAIAFT